MNTNMNFVDKSGKNFFLRKIDLKSNHFDILNFYEFDNNKYPFLLESSATGNERTRYSILFYEPKIKLEKKRMRDEIDFLKKLDFYVKKEKIKQDKFLLDDGTFLPFLGGWFLYLGYELVMEIEKKIKIPESPYNLPTAILARVKTAVIHDKKEKNLYLISEDSKEEIEIIYKDFKKLANKKRTLKLLKNSITIINKDSKTKHQKYVKKCIDYIFQGEIFQANLSRLWEFKVKKKISDELLYSRLRVTNPSPFSGIIKIGKSTIISSSPERLVSLKNRKIETRPIAGTRPRGSTGMLDVELCRELISSEKERAEHLMLVDLERNDLSRVCEFGSVKVDEMMVIESYSHVHHIVSNVSGKIKKHVKPGQIISAVFPGGTITGCPKIRCIEILGELEKVGRGPYTGSLGYINNYGDLDINILIRTMIREGENLSLRAGGGIVADSIPEKETQETEAKANGMLKALKEIYFQ